jgi:hypothetical protein
MKKNLVKKLGELVKKKSKISVKSAAKSLNIKEEEIVEIVMKLSDEFAVTKSNNKIFNIIYNKKPNVKEIINELTKIIKKIKEPQFKEIKKALLSCVMFLEKKQYIDNVDKVKKGIFDYSKKLQDHIKLSNDMDELKKKSDYYSELVKKFSKKIDDDTKIMKKHSKMLNDLFKLMRKCYENLKKKMNKTNNSTQSLYLLITGKKIKHKSVIELLGIKKLMPEKKIVKKKTKKRNKNNIKKGVKNSADKENNFIPHDEKNEHKTKFMKMSGKFQTEIDELLNLVKKEGTVSFNKLAKIYQEKIEIIEQWSESLEEMKIISIHYPLIGSPYIKYEKKEMDK